MDSTHYLTYGWSGLVTAAIAGKWALDLGASQSRQLLWMIGGFLFAPLVLVILYVRLIRQRCLGTVKFTRSIEAARHDVQGS